MTAIHVCSLARMPGLVAEVGASHIATLISAGTPVPRPEPVAAENHLVLSFNDIIEPTEGLTPPGEHHVAALLDFIRAWDRSKPLVIHCWAGISRSTAAAVIAHAALNPDEDERVLAAAVRARSPSATPNARLIGFADSLLGRDGRMVAAVRAIGRGADAFEGKPFSLPLGPIGS